MLNSNHPTLYITLLLLLFSTHASASIIHSERSLYRNIQVEDTGDLRCLNFKQKKNKSNQSCFYKSNPEKLVFNYTKLLFSALLVNKQPQRILIIGLGGGTMSNTLHQLFPDSVIDNVEIDPAVVKVAREYFGFFENEKVKTYHQDGRIFVKRALIKKQQYDWIILDAFNGEYIPEHLLTQEFLQETKNLLSPKGVLTANTFSISQLYQHESATYQAVFGEFYNVRNNKNENRIILVSQQQLPNKNDIVQNIQSLNAKLKAFDIDIRDIYNSMISSKQNQDWPTDTRLLTDQFSPANLLNFK